MGNPASLPPPRGCSLCDRRWVGRWYDDPAFVRAMVARWTQPRRQGLVREILRGIARDVRALSGPQVRNLRRWPMLLEYLHAACPKDGVERWIKHFDGRRRSRT
jgi:hypothetical protein